MLVTFSIAKLTKKEYIGLFTPNLICCIFLKRVSLLSRFSNLNFYMKVNMIDMKEDTSQRLSNLRDIMRREHLDAFVFPSTDPNNSEYVPDHWKGREWLTGFTGSAGTAVVTMHEAALWTDSRYFLAAAQQLNGTEFKLMRERVEGTPTIAEW